MPNINPYSTYKMALLSVLYILADAQFILVGANTAQGGTYMYKYARGLQITVMCLGHKQCVCTLYTTDRYTDTSCLLHMMQLHVLIYAIIKLCIVQEQLIDSWFAKRDKVKQGHIHCSSCRFVRLNNIEGGIYVSLGEANLLRGTHQ